MEEKGWWSFKYVQLYLRTVTLADMHKCIGGGPRDRNQGGKLGGSCSSQGTGSWEPGFGLIWALLPCILPCGAGNV